MPVAIITGRRGDWAGRWPRAWRSGAGTWCWTRGRPEALAAAAGELARGRRAAVTPRWRCGRRRRDRRGHRAELVAAARRLGGVDLLVNNASALGAEPLVPLAELAAGRGCGRRWRSNVVAPLALVQAALPLLRARRRARC